MLWYSLAEFVMETTLLLYFSNVNKMNPSPYLSPCPSASMAELIFLAPLWNICKLLGISTKKSSRSKIFSITVPKPNIWVWHNLPPPPVVEFCGISSETVCCHTRNIYATEIIRIKATPNYPSYSHSYELNIIATPPPQSSRILRHPFWICLVSPMEHLCQVWWLYAKMHDKIAKRPYYLQK